MPGLSRRLSAAAYRPTAALWLLWGLVLAMLLSPALGRVHQVLHAPALQGAAVLTASVVAGDRAATDPRAADHGLLALFAGHKHSDCLLLDQLSAWAGPSATGPLLPAALPQEPPAQARMRIVCAGSAAYFNARAPPAVVHG